MSYRYKFIIAFLLLLSTAAVVRAQNNVIHEMLSRLQSHQSISYSYTYKQKDFTDDTLIREHHDILYKVPEDKALGYYFSNREKDHSAKDWLLNVYNDKGLFSCNPGDSSYTTSSSQAMEFSATLLGRLKWIDGFIDKHPAQFTKQEDTTVAGKSYDQWKLVTRDTVINGEHLFTRFHILIDKQSQLLYMIQINARTDQLGAGIVNAYNNNCYTAYKFDDPAVTIETMQLPKGLHPHADHEPKEPLTNGTIAPPWTLTSTDGKQLSLADLKGKVVVMDYFFIGCQGCMLSIPSLNRLHDRFKTKGVVFISVDDHDKKETLATFKNKFKLQYPVFYDGAIITKPYRLYSAPLFYIIDTKGRIIESISNGYTDDLESKLSKKITALLAEGK